MTNPPTPQGVTLREALDLIDEIVLAGMSGTGMESKEAMNEWHAQQAWKFIRIAAKAKEKLKSALSHPPAPEQASVEHPVTLRDALQKRCYEWGVYWRSSDAHGVKLTTEQALELLRDALGVEVEIAATPTAEPAVEAVEVPHGIEFFMNGKNMAFKIGVQSFTLAYEPDEPEEFEFMKSMLLHALSTFTPDVKTAVDRFIGWKLPYDFYPDCYIEFDRAKANAMGSWPIGTNLFTVDQAKAMFEYALSAFPAAPEAAKPDNWQQYAQDGENAQQCIERHRKEQDALLTLLANARRPYSDNEEMKL